MNGAFYIAATGLRSEQHALDVVANNIANVNTPAFKRSQVRFSELVGVSPTDAAQPSQQAGQQSDSLSGVMADGSPRVFTQGELRPTGQPMDLAISGEGFIELMGPAGQTYLWRGGTLKVNGDGYLVAGDSDLPLKSMISVPAGVTSMTIAANGQVSAVTNGSAQAQSIGQIELVVAKDLSHLEPVGGQLYKADANARLAAMAPGEEGAGTLVQASLEGSNVQLADEMVTMLLIQRAYAANAQVVQAGDQLMQISNELRRG